MVVLFGTGKSPYDHRGTHRTGYLLPDPEAGKQLTARRAVTVGGQLLLSYNKDGVLVGSSGIGGGIGFSDGSVVNYEGHILTLALCGLPWEYLDVAVTVTVAVAVAVTVAVAATVTVTAATVTVAAATAATVVEVAVRWYCT
ncbi:hypothetical protein K432DRAFT_404999 [Lepidopterella palustris CBS 459.81]|uniref:Uncharacterized protein n=1 Tax=Lepidopterella palustris CBS 459.81 TaxID=1314670 RepID=A0A8E2JFK1_9PEZI|nr:hypothetical protein K432DRAFT_404999 [Lepidopterella palustris CBS 459.81]